MPEATQQNPAAWDSTFMQQWQEDIEIVEKYCAGIEARKKKLRAASRTKSRVKRAKAAEEICSGIELILEIPEKWRGFPYFYSDFRKYISQVQDLRGYAGSLRESPFLMDYEKHKERRRKRKPFKRRLALCFASFIVGALLYTAYDQFTLSIERAEREEKVIQEKIDRANKVLDDYCESLRKGIEMYGEK